MAWSGMMPDPSLTIRISRSTHELLCDLAAKSNATITSVVDEAVRDLQRKKFWADFNSACGGPSGQSRAVRADLQREDTAWEQTLADGLEEEHQPDEPKRRRRKPRPR